MNNFITFGSPAVFELAARWTEDKEPRSNLPRLEGWSTGDIRITVGGQVLTANKYNGRAKNHISWYLAPLVEWFIANWTWLFHEESYSWNDRSGQPAALETLSAIERTIGSQDVSGIDEYEKVQSWWMRHALRAADSSAVYPDVYFRRVVDDIEISWQSRQPAYAPESFALMLAPGYMLLPVNSVAEPIWKFLEWATRPSESLSETDQEAIAHLRSKLELLRSVPLSKMELTYINSKVRDVLQAARAAVGWETQSKMANFIPAIDELDSSVLMFGGLDVEIRKKDAVTLMQLLTDQKNGDDTPELTCLISDPFPGGWSRPFEEGYTLANDLRDELAIEPDQIFVDIFKVLDSLGITIVETRLETNLIRGVAIAGNGFSPAILVNTNSVYNFSTAGKRFTLAHELCHVLYDRTRAKRLSHVSGPWTAARTEKRANAFAAMFLASTSALKNLLLTISPNEIHRLSEIYGLSYTSLVEHLYNVRLINDAQRESLRPQ